MECHVQRKRLIAVACTATHHTQADTSKQVHVILDMMILYNYTGFLGLGHGCCYRGREILDHYLHVNMWPR